MIAYSHPAEPGHWCFFRDTGVLGVRRAAYGAVLAVDPFDVIIDTAALHEDHSARLVEIGEWLTEEGLKYAIYRIGIDTVIFRFTSLADAVRFKLTFGEYVSGETWV